MLNANTFALVFPIVIFFPVLDRLLALLGIPSSYMSQAILLVITLPAEFIANDKPILVSYKGELYTPIFKAYPETTFEGQFETVVLRERRLH